MGALRGVYGLRTVVPGRGGEREEVYHIVLHLEDRRALAVHHGERWRAHRKVVRHAAAEDDVWVTARTPTLRVTCV